MRTIIALEGPNGVGKTTLADGLAKKLQSLNINCKVFREPGGIKESEYIRDTIMKCENNISNRTQLLLFFASRNNLLEYISKNEPEDEIIILDRFVLSSMVYQKDMVGTNKLFKFISKDKKFRLINILLDAKDEFLQDRIDNRDKKDKNFFEKNKEVRELYRKLWIIDNDIIEESIPGALEKVDIDTDDIDTNVNRILKVLENYGINDNTGEYSKLMKQIVNLSGNEDEFKELSLEELIYLKDYLILHGAMTDEDINEMEEGEK